MNRIRPGNCSGRKIGEQEDASENAILGTSCITGGKMIVRQKSGFFGRRTTAIHTPTFTCTIITQRQGFLKPYATVIREGDGSGNLPHICGRISYFPEFERSDIHHLHAAIVQSMDEDGEKGFPLGAAIEGVIEFVKEEGLAAETINAACWGPAGLPGT